ncbi:DNA ligase (ATP) [Labilithrix luteola]|uniref:DNA ligase (ATP) n=1 Tax=Labilithrix luteola TaxID=1391654 RepID=A0A0K1PJR5_9BACT|nr:DNA ligase [Labilithrix luteola]AKU93349.1 DNA ligase (ATP) [Labilithrix luteola]AKU93417.1 DNA ligase (ATP) [Labilithrix luteola]
MAKATKTKPEKRADIDIEVLLAKPWTDKVDPTGWWMSEKLDGVRAIWKDGEFWSRNGKPFYAPDWFKAQMPSTQLDGELFIGRKQFDATVSAVRSSSGDWSKVKYHVFDLYPEGESWSSSFEERQELLARILRERPYIEHVPQVRCTGIKHLTETTDVIINELHGEGIMLREPHSLYEQKRSSTLLKVKRFFDIEATVLGHVPGKGKHEGRLGALDCVTDHGGSDRVVKFQVGTGFTDAERENPPVHGSIITVRYQELTKDSIPRFPVFVAVRDYE